MMHLLRFLVVCLERVDLLRVVASGVELVEERDGLGGLLVLAEPVHEVGLGVS